MIEDRPQEPESPVRTDAVDERDEAERADEAMAGQSPSVEAPVPERQEDDRSRDLNAGFPAPTDPLTEGIDSAPDAAEPEPVLEGDAETEAETETTEGPGPDQPVEEPLSDEATEALGGTGLGDPDVEQDPALGGTPASAAVIGETSEADQLVADAREPALEDDAPADDGLGAEAQNVPEVGGGFPGQDADELAAARPEISADVPEPTPETAGELAAEPASSISEGIEAEDQEAERTPTPAAEAPEQDGEAAPAASDGDPFAGPGDWYVIHTYAGYENKVKTNLSSRIQSMQMQDKIFDVVVPMRDEMEIKGGKKQVVQKKVFPGYLLVKMDYDNDSWYVVRNTPGVTGFVASGTGQKPTPLPRREAEKFLVAPKEEAKPTFRLDFEEGDVVRIISGPFADFTGTIQEINLDQAKVKVMVNIFDRETPVELGFDDVTRV